ncbi:speckle-type POZ protein-like isoform X1 [Frankliniella occidentalis]|uniref:Speckle-type POZ protein-like isoform X1 n=2 Tax=Frankliniella occidentalis TaxID=133901 RepID=A0A6J1SNP9_FRAOC|nr:speckle-type POZ protein-like isoform X1 [Frankliniella occidentalis]
MQRTSQYPGMRLLQVSEQTVRRRTVEKLKLELERFPLTPLRIKGGLLSFKPSLLAHQVKEDDSRCTVSLYLRNCEGSDRLLVLCRMTGGFYARGQSQEAPARAPQVVERRFIINCDEDDGETRRAFDMDEVISLQPDHPFDQVTVLFHVYDVASPRAAVGVGHHLNQARLQGNLCDLKLVVEGVELLAHRLVLAARSPVLSNMLTGDFREAREGRVELVDASRVVVEKFLEFLYTDLIEEWQDSELELLQLAHKYMVPELGTECSLRLWSCDPPGALEVLHAVGLSEIICGPLRQRLTAIVVDNHKVLADTPQWLEFKKTFPVLVDTMLGHKAQTSYTMASVWSL